MDFQLHPRLAADTVFLADWHLSRVLLMNDSRFAWVVLVPRKPALKEVFDLDARERAVLMEELSRAAVGLKSLPGCTKVNIGALGNLVEQLHIHVVARNSGDAAWPGPVWGSGSAIRYEADALQTISATLLSSL